MTEAAMLDALADAVEAAATVLRRHAAQLKAGVVPAEDETTSVIDRARLTHPMLGFRQEQVLRKLVDAGAGGTTTGALSSALDYDQANVHITLQALVERGFAAKDASVYPHIYRLGSVLSPPLVPFHQANPETRDAFLAGLRDMRGLDGNPAVWQCTVCRERIEGDDVLISYNVPRPIPYCTTETEPGRSCAGSGPDLVPAE